MKTYIIALCFGQPRSFEQEEKFGRSQLLKKMYTSFHHVGKLCYTTVKEMLETMHENDLFKMFPAFCTVVHILAVIPAT